MYSDTITSRLALRGLPNRSDDAFRRMIPWTRIAFAVGGVQTCIATMTASADMLWTMAPIAALAVVMPHHLIEYVYNFAIRHITKTEPLPRNGAPVRFAFGMMAVMLALTALAFDAGVFWLGFLLGTSIVMVSATVCLTHFCLPAAIYGWLFGDRSQVRCAMGV